LPEPAPYRDEVARANLPEICLVGDLSRVLRKSPGRVRELLKSGTLPGRKLGRTWVVRREDLLAALSPAVPRRTSAPPGVAWCRRCVDRPAGPRGLCAVCEHPEGLRP